MQDGPWNTESFQDAEPTRPINSVKTFDKIKGDACTLLLVTVGLLEEPLGRVCCLESTSGGEEPRDVTSHVLSKGS